MATELEKHYSRISRTEIDDEQWDELEFHRDKTKNTNTKIMIITG